MTDKPTPLLPRRCSTSIVPIGLVLAAASITATALELPELKGFVIGQELARCPADTIEESDMKLGARLCNLPATTFAGQAAPAHAVAIAGGRVLLISVRLAERGSQANGAVLAALREKFGAPDIRKAHLNQYRWEIGPGTLFLDGWEGTVTLVDVTEYRRLQTQTAKKNKSDL